VAAERSETMLERSDSSPKGGFFIVNE